MERIIFGDNQFFGVNHISDEKARAQSIKFKQDESILKTLDMVRDEGVNTFMCTTHERISTICDLIRAKQDTYRSFKIYPCLPYAHKYANAVTELGMIGALKQYVPGNFISSVFKGGFALASKDIFSLMELLIDSEMKMFKGLNTPVIFLQNVITDLLIGLRMKDVFKAYHTYIIKKYNAEPGYITMNMPVLLDLLEEIGIRNPVICSSINIDGFRMSGGKDLYEHILNTRELRAIAMQVLSGGAASPSKAIQYVTSLPNVQSILFGASSRPNIHETVSLINQYDRQLALSMA
ncbi:MAG: hypothetical protein ACK5AO_02350 [bacterium]|jgi:hypothetical protein